MGGIVMKPTDLMINDWVLWHNRYVQMCGLDELADNFKI